ncbi:hypothetical protein SAMN05878503_11352 [Cereibacter ovatus]|uniref:Phosphoadenosine phosphosulfate reductase n=1 Tax=Cereibacter ovatus TaxID=439529 RepID=A0A285D0H0_9RHOB|nr:hypothetical protein SAMN05878503_11352 [Cereibacter ovatus]
MTIPSASCASSAFAGDRGVWLRHIEEVGEEAGYFQPLGARHHAFFRDEGATLVVSFETQEEIRIRRPDGLPLGDAVARAEGWSSLCLIADGPTWYRDPAVYRYFDRLVDDAFFEDFDRVVFHGAGMGGYAACAYSLTAPGAVVVAVSPRATLDPARAGWDGRDRAARRLDFRDRYGYAPDMVEGTGEVFVLHDPAEPLDAMHAALFGAGNVRHLRCRNAGEPLQALLERTGMTAALLRDAGRGTLDLGAAARIWRGRRAAVDYLVHHLALNARHPERARRVLLTAGRQVEARQLRQQLLALRARVQAEARSA